MIVFTLKFNGEQMKLLKLNDTRVLVYRGKLILYNGKVLNSMDMKRHKYVILPCTRVLTISQFSHYTY